MTELDRARLDRLLPATPGAPDWNDVLSRTRAGHGRRRALVVLAAVAAVAVVSASALAVREFLIDKGYIGIPPVGATPSSPKSGTLVLSAFGHARRSRTGMWVYADGRLIWQRENPRGSALAVSANRLWSGVLEQRLTKTGVRLLRREALATGLFGQDLALTLDSQPCWNFIHVRTGGRLAKVRWHGSHCLIGSHSPTGTRPATRSEVDRLRRLVERVTHPASWLPASAWRDRRVRAYVPTQFEVLYGPWPRRVTFPDIWRPLPSAARALLRARKVERSSGQTNSPAGGLVPTYTYRFRVTTAEARSLRAMLAAAGLEVDWTMEAAALAYLVNARHPRFRASLMFLPILPHGTAASPAG